jgi:glycerophosphoryl diester phosphodiesterase
VAEVRRLVPGAATLALIEAVPVHPTGFAKEAGVTHVGIAIDSTTEEFVAALQRDGFKVFVYTANDPRDISWLRNLKADGIVSDYPERLQETGKISPQRAAPSSPLP